MSTDALEAGGRAPREQRLALGAAAVSVVLWASAFVGIRAAGHSFSAGPLSLARLVVGTVALGSLALARREAMPPRRDLAGLLVCGLTWFGAYNVLLNQAERGVDAGTAAMLVNTGPIFIAVLGGLLLGEGFPRRLLAGCAIAFAGTAVIAFATSTRGIQAGVGAILCVGAAAAYATGVVVEKPMLERSSALSVTWLACSIGAVACLPFAPQLSRELGHAGPGALGWVVYLGVFPTAVGFSTWAYALARTSAGRLGASTYLVPPLAVLMGWALLGDVPPLLALVGGLLCLGGVGITRGISLRRRPAVPVGVIPDEAAGYP